MTPLPDDRAALLARFTETGDREALDRLLRLELEPVKRSFRRRLARSARSPSLDTSDYVDEAVGRLLREAEQAAAAIIGAHRAELATLIEQLERKETLDRHQIEACLGPAHGRKGTPAAAAAE